MAKVVGVEADGSKLLQGKTLVQRVHNNKSKYTVCDYCKAHLAKKIQNTIGHPSLWAFLDIVDKKMISNCPITRKDVMAAEDIFGPNVSGLKGKTVRRIPEHVDVNFSKVPFSLLKKHGYVMLCINIMFVN